MDFVSFSPKNWEVISCEPEKSRYENRKDFSHMLNEIDCPHDLCDRFTEEDAPVLRIFKQTPKISTYLYAFVVGPYVFA